MRCVAMASKLSSAAAAPAPRGISARWPTRLAAMMKKPFSKARERVERSQA